jgi:hypothetical protein
VQQSNAGRADKCSSESVRKERWSLDTKVGRRDTQKQTLRSHFIRRRSGGVIRARFVGCRFAVGQEMLQAERQGELPDDTTIDD